MRKRISNSEILLAILKKDARVYSRNLIYLFLTILGLAVFVTIFWLVPDEVEEEITFAVSPSLSTLISEGREELLAIGFPAEALEQLDELETAFTEEGLMLVELEDEELLKQVISGEIEVYKTDQSRLLFYDPEGDQKKPANLSRVNLQIGIAFPAAFLSEAVRGEIPKVIVYADAAVPEELRGAMEGFIRELTFQLAGSELPVELPEEDTIILGVDRMGAQISMQTRMRPLIAFFMLMMETFALASLISNEVLQRTVTALLVTPMRVGHFLMAKTIFGTVLALGQALIVLALVRAFTADNWSLLLVTIILGALLFTAVAMLVGAAGKDFIGQLMFSMLFLVPLMIPSFAVLFPGSVAAWVKVLPSYPIVRLLYDVTVHNALWSDSVDSLIYALLWVVVIYGAGLFVLRRKVATL
ncbi:MAG: ABC transporter permease [Bacillota bacterium]|nr:ABC transporter permease [Bacillota bacterium]